MCSCPDIASGRAGLANDSLWRLSSVLRTSLIICRLVSRIRPNRVCAAAFRERDFSTDYLSLSVALHEALLARSYFQLLAGSSAREGLSPSCSGALPSA